MKAPSLIGASEVAMNAKRLVSLFFVSSTLLAWGIFAKTIELVFSMTNVTNRALLGKGFTMATLLGAVAALALLFWAWRHRKIRPMINEVGDELSKVVWPTWDDTKNNTVITVIVTIASMVVVGFSAAEE